MAALKLHITGCYDIVMVFSVVYTVCPRIMLLSDPTLCFIVVDTLRDTDVIYNYIFHMHMINWYLKHFLWNQS